MIIFKSQEVQITNGQFSLEQIYQDAGNNGIVSKVGDNSYFIDGDLIIGNGTDDTTLLIQNQSLEISGERFQVLKNATLQMGHLNSDGSTEQGAQLTAPNIKLAYGFGSDSVNNGQTQSGDLKLYGSRIDVFGFWGFFGGVDQIVDIRDCIINGFGRIEGSQSVLKNVTFEKANGHYGILSPKGAIAQLEQITVKQSVTTNGQRCEIYLNPSFVDSLTIRDGVFANYDQLVYCESSSKSTPVFAELIDCSFDNGVSGFFSDAGTVIYETYSFNALLLQGNGQPIDGANITLTNAQGQTVYAGSTQAGVIDTLVRVQQVSQSGVVSHNPFTLTAKKDGLTSTWQFEIHNSFKAVPFYLVEASTQSTSGFSQQDIDLIKAVLTGRRKLDKTTNTLTHYFADGTEAVKFNTLDANGNPSTDVVYEVVPL